MPRRVPLPLTCICICALTLLHLCCGKKIKLPDGIQPESCTDSAGNTVSGESLPIRRGTRSSASASTANLVYASSSVSNNIYAFDGTTGVGCVVVDSTQSAAQSTTTFRSPTTRGIKYDYRTGYLYACGAFDGVLRVYDVNNGFTLVRTILLTNISHVLINDLVITTNALYVTNSFVSEFYKVDLASSGSGSLPNPAVVTTISLIGQFKSVNGNPNVFMENGTDVNSNGIVTPDGGKTLLIVNTASGVIYKVDSSTGNATALTLDEDALYGDGMLLVNGLLYVVLNKRNVIKVYELLANYTAGKTLCNITSSEFDFPTGIAYIPNTNSLYIPNRRFELNYSVNNTYDVADIFLGNQCKCLNATGCASCSVGLSCHDFGNNHTQCIEKRIPVGKCVNTNHTGCSATIECCNPSATCTELGECLLPCQSLKQFTSLSVPTISPSAVPTAALEGFYNKSSVDTKRLFINIHSYSGANIEKYLYAQLASYFLTFKLDSVSLPGLLR